MITEKLLQELKSCDKYIEKLVPAKEKTQNNHKQQTVVIYSSDKKFYFEIFIRRNIDLPNDFSIWLQWKWSEWTKTLCRYNGDHWWHRNKLDKTFIRWFHKHKYNIEYKENWLSDDAYAEEIKEYSSFQEAIGCLCKDYSINNYSTYFDTFQQSSLFN